jgi:hypothetical protein
MLSLKIVPIAVRRPNHVYREADAVDEKEYVT